MLANSGEPGPFVLVGHSNGGLRAALYAHAYPQEVAGVVLVDPTPRATILEHSEDAELIKEAMDELPAEFREILVLRPRKVSPTRK